MNLFRSLKVAVAGSLVLCAAGAGGYRAYPQAQPPAEPRQTTKVAVPVKKSAESAQVGPIRYGDGRADGKQSVGGSGEMIEFTTPRNLGKVGGLRIHGSRYGTPQAPDESFLIFFLSHDRERILHTEMAPYTRFDRGPEKWVTISFDTPVELPERFWVVLDFRATSRKGVYVSYDTSTGGKHSRVGLPGTPTTETRFGGDWMIELTASGHDGRTNK